jgi:hypothetical protein
MSHQLYRFLRPDEPPQINNGDLYVIEGLRYRTLRPVPSGWRRWEDVKPTEADATEVGFIYWCWNDGGSVRLAIAVWNELPFPSTCSTGIEIHWHPLPRLPELKKPDPDPYAELKAAYTAGKTIQGGVEDAAGRVQYLDMKRPAFDSSILHYRIKPEPLDERARFESAIKDRLDFTSGPYDGGYAYSHTAAAWLAWQAATSQKEVSV